MACMVLGAACLAANVNGYTFRGSNSSTFIFASLLNGGQYLKDRINSFMSKVYSVRVIPIPEQLLFH